MMNRREFITLLGGAASHGRSQHARKLSARVSAGSPSHRIPTSMVSAAA